MTGWTFPKWLREQRLPLLTVVLVLSTAVVGFQSHKSLEQSLLERDRVRAELVNLRTTVNSVQSDLHTIYHGISETNDNTFDGGSVASDLATSVRIAALPESSQDVRWSSLPQMLARLKSLVARNHSHWNLKTVQEGTRETEALRTEARRVEAIILRGQFQDIRSFYGLFASVSAGVVLLLLAQLFLIQRPLYRRMKATNEKLQTQSDELMERNRMLQDLQLSLANQNLELVAQREVLESALREHEVTQELLTLASHRFQNLFHGAPVACFTCDLEGNIFEWNTASEVLWGHQAFTVFERSVFDILIPKSHHASVREQLATAAASNSELKVQLALHDAKGNTKETLLTAVPVRGGQGLISGFIISCVDLSDIHAAQERIRLLSLMSERTPNGLTLADSNGQILDVNPACQTIFGADAEALRGANLVSTWQAYGASKAVLADIQLSLDEAKPGQWIIQSHDETGQLRAYEFTLSPASHGSHGPSHYIGVINDVTERILHERELKENDARFRTVMSAIQSGVLIYGPSGKLTYANRFATDSLALRWDSKKQLFGFPKKWSLATPEEEPLEGSVLLEFDGNDRPVHETVFQLQAPNAQPRYISVVDVKLDAHAVGEHVGGLRTFVDITNSFHLRRQLETQLMEIAEINVQLEMQTGELEMLNSKLESLASTDGLTGLTNHRSFRERLQLELQKSVQTGKPLSLVLLDVDHFKMFNDTFGHQAGDDVLRGVATCLSEVARDSDLVARYGGEEFVLILPRADQVQAQQVAERFRAHIDQQEWPNRHVTASFGVTTFDPSMGESPIPNALIEQADQALYSSKRAGRNRVTHFLDIHAGNISAA